MRTTEASITAPAKVHFMIQSPPRVEEWRGLKRWEAASHCPFAYTSPLLYPMDNHHVDPAGLDVGKQTCQRRPVHVAAGEAAVVVTLGQADPALVRLALDVGLGRLALGVERVEVLVKPFLGG